MYWISCADADAIAGQIAAGAALPDDTLPQAARIEAVYAACLSALPRLLILDNCEDADLVQGLRPPWGGCKVLVTSRVGEWPVGSGVQALPLYELPRRQSIALLCRHRADFDAGDPDLDAIAEELGDLALALHLASSYLEQYRGAGFATPTDYLEELRAVTPLAHDSLAAGEAARNVEPSFRLSLDRLDPNDADDRAARELLDHLACLAPGALAAISLLARCLGPEPDEPPDEPSRAQERAAHDAVRRLHNLGLISRPSDDGVAIHRLIAAAVTASAVDIEAARRRAGGIVLHDARSITSPGCPRPSCHCCRI